MARRAIQDNDPRLVNVLDFVIDHKRKYDRLSPSFQEISDHLGVNSTSLVSHYLRILQKYGRLRLVGGGAARGIIVTGGAWRYSPPSQTEPANLSEQLA